MKVSPVGDELFHTDGQTDRHDEAIVAFHKVAKTPKSSVGIYSGADKSLAWPGRKQATFPAFYGTWKFIATFTRVHHLSPTLAKSIHSSAHHTFDRRSLFPSWSG